MAKKYLVALITVGVIVVIFAVCLISAVQLLAPREMPFGVTGPSPVVAASRRSIRSTSITYSSEAT